jgi:DNA-binding protein HU-beta
MNKTDLINAIAEAAGLTKADATKALNATTAAIANAVKNDDKVALVGFGTFSVSERPGRTGKNPRTGEVIEIPAKKVVKFKAGAELADKVK